MSWVADPTTAIKCELIAEVAQTFGGVRLRVTGASMLPSIWPGDRLIVQRKPPNQIQPGQVILYRRNSGVVAHRVIARRGDQFVTHGDCMEHPDAPVHASEIVGEVVSVEREERRVAPEWTLWKQACAWALRRSDFAVRALLHWHCQSRRTVPLRTAPDFATL